MNVMLLKETSCNSLIVIRAGSVSVFGVGIGIFSCRFGIRYLEIPRYSVFLKYWLKIANFWYLTPLIFVAPVEGPVGISQSGPFWKTRMMGPPGDEKV